MNGRSAGAFVRARHAGIGRAFGSTVMAVYVLVLLTVFLTPLAINVLTIVLTHPLVAQALASPNVLNWVALALGLLILGAIGAGEVRGPIAPGRFEASVRLQSPEPRWRSLGPTALRALCATAMSLGGLGLVLGITGRISLGWSVGTVVWASVGGLGLGLAVVNARLAGQAANPCLTVGCSAVLGATSALALNYDAFALILVVELALLALSTPVLVPFCLTRIGTETVLRHSALAEASAALTTTGDWAAASREYRPAPTSGRHTRVLPLLFSAAIPRTPWGLWRSAWRTSRRAFAGVALVVLGALIVGCGLSLMSGSHSIPADLVVVGIVLAAALSLISWGLGAFSGSLEFAAETAGSVAVFRLSARAMLARSGASFAALALGLSVPLIVVLGGLVNGGFGFLSPSLGGALILGLVQLAMARIHAATKGPLPAVMTTPIPSPVGDVSVLLILAWQFEAVGYGPTAAAIIITLTTINPWWMAASVVLILIMIRGARARLRN